MAEQEFSYFSLLNFLQRYHPDVYDDWREEQMWKTNKKYTDEDDD